MHDLVLLGVRQCWEERNRQGLVVVALRRWEVATTKAQLGVVGLQVHRNVVHVHPKARRTQLIENIDTTRAGALRVDLDRVQVPG